MAVPRKKTHDSDAYDVAVDTFTGVIEARPAADPHVVADDLAHAFDYAEFESVTTKAAGADIALRRVVLTGPWEVVPK